MKLGILGGTFNPIHNGHLINAEVIRDQFGLDRILFIPAKYPVHKELADNISAEDRCTMVGLAIAGNSYFDVSRMEVDRIEPSYTITTVTELIKQYRDSELNLIVGTDSLHEINTWKDVDELKKLVKIIVMTRPVEERPDKHSADLDADIQFSKNPSIEISSTCIRERIKKGQSIKYLIPDAVIEYIYQKELYKN